MTGAVIPAGRGNTEPTSDLPTEWQVSAILPTLVVEAQPHLGPDMVLNIAGVFIEDRAPLVSFKGGQAMGRARVIAAAPTLLRALSEMVAITGPFVRAGVSSPRMIAVHNAATAAIEQATRL